MSQENSPLCFDPSLHPEQETRGADKLGLGVGRKPRLWHLCGWIARIPEGNPGKSRAGNRGDGGRGRDIGVAGGVWSTDPHGERAQPRAAEQQPVHARSEVLQPARRWRHIRAGDGNGVARVRQHAPCIQASATLPSCISSRDSSLRRVFTPLSRSSACLRARIGRLPPLGWQGTAGAPRADGCDARSEVVHIGQGKVPVARADGC